MLLLQKLWLLLQMFCFCKETGMYFSSNRIPHVINFISGHHVPFDYGLLVQWEFLPQEKKRWVFFKLQITNICFLELKRKNYFENALRQHFKHLNTKVK